MVRVAGLTYSLRVRSAALWPLSHGSIAERRFPNRHEHQQQEHAESEFGAPSLAKETKGERRRQRSAALPARWASPLFFNLPFLPLKTVLSEYARPRAQRYDWRADVAVAGDGHTPLRENWSRRGDSHSRGANARQFTKLLLSLLSHAGLLKRGTGNEECGSRKLLSNPSCSALRAPNSAFEFVGRHGAAPLAVRKHLCGLGDRCIAAMLATQERHEGGVEPPQPGLCSLGRHRDFASRKMNR